MQVYNIKNLAHTCKRIFSDGIRFNSLKTKVVLGLLFRWSICYWSQYNRACFITYLRRIQLETSWMGFLSFFWIFFCGPIKAFWSDSNPGSCSISFILFNRGTHVIENSGNEADLRQQVLVIYQVGDLLSVTQPHRCWVKKEQGWLFKRLWKLVTVWLEINEGQFQKLQSPPAISFFFLFQNSGTNAFQFHTNGDS